ncbi:MAG TPA: response regulator [Terriglobales bacterium]|nr:response regulator [Terriglobales bacterium]
MQKLLVVSHDDITGKHIRTGLADGFDVHQASTVEQALAFAIEHKPNGIIIDFALPRMSGIELCQSLRGITYTSRIPVFALIERNNPGPNFSKEDLGVTSFFEKPVEIEEIKNRLNYELEGQRPQRRAHVRIRMRTILKLSGTDANGKRFDELTATENVSVGGFLCNSTTTLEEGAVVEVYLVSDSERRVGKARVARKEKFVGPWQRYGFQFEEKTTEWVVQE